MFKGAQQRVQETCGGKRQGGAGLREKERRLREGATTHGTRAQGLLEQMRAPWREAKKRQLLKAPLPKMPPSTLPPFGKWEVTGGGGGGCPTVLWLWCTKWGVEVDDLAGTNASESCCNQLRKGGFEVTLHTSPSHCNQENCLYIAVRVLLWRMQHPTREWSKPPPPPPLEMMPCQGGSVGPWLTGQQLGCKRPGTLPPGCKRPGTLPPGEPVGALQCSRRSKRWLWIRRMWGKGPVPFAPVTGNMVPLVMLP